MLFGKLGVLNALWDFCFVLLSSAYRGLIKMISVGEYLSPQICVSVFHSCHVAQGGVTSISVCFLPSDSSTMEVGFLMG